MKKIIGCLFVILSTLIFGCAEAEHQESFITNSQQEAVKGERKDISVQEFNTLITTTNGILLDVRTPEEWAKGIIKDAVKINFHDENFLSEASKLPKNKVIYVYCKKGGRSEKAAT